MRRKQLGSIYFHVACAMKYVNDSSSLPYRETKDFFTVCAVSFEKFIIKLLFSTIFDFWFQLFYNFFIFRLVWQYFTCYLDDNFCACAIICILNSSCILLLFFSPIFYLKRIPDKGRHENVIDFNLKCLIHAFKNEYRYSVPTH